ncbi:MAG: phosphotransferase [bacterium]|nr:phosphotransferase [bacterium]
MQKLYPDNQIQITEESITKILSEYEIFDFTHQPIHEGIANTSFVIHAEKKCVLRIYSQDRKSDEDVLFEIEFQDYLREQGIPIPIIYKNNEAEELSVIEIDGKQWQCILMEYVEGQSVTMYPSSELIMELAQIQAKIHLLGMAFAETSQKPKDQWKDLHDTMATKLGTIPVQTDDVLEFIERVKKYKYTLSEDLPYGYHHLDLDFDGNVITKDGSIAGIVDFDDLSYSPVVVCLGFTLWDILDNAGSRAMRLYLSTYEKIRPLTTLEMEALPHVILFRNYVMGVVRLMLWEERTPIEDIQNIFKLEQEIPSLFEA